MLKKFFKKIKKSTRSAGPSKPGAKSSGKGASGKGAAPKGQQASIMAFFGKK